MLAILLNMKSVFARALVPVTIITFCGICALAPLYVTLGVLQRQITNINNN
jgi:hypothetical protein